jgi:hypothetical protein
MINVQMFLVVLGLVLLLLAALQISHPKIHFGWLGLFLWLLSTMMR